MGEDFYSELRTLLNKYSIDNYAKTPDFILAQYVEDCLAAYGKAIEQVA